jgi:hypothetical protein
VSSDEPNPVSTYLFEGIVWLVVTHVLLGMVLAFAAHDSDYYSYGDPDPFFAVFLGIVFSQTSLLAIWGSLGTGVWWKRLIGVICGIIYIFFLTGTCIGKAYEEAFLDIGVVAAFVAVVLLVVRVLRIIIHHDTSTFTLAGSFQFSIRQLLILTFALACLLAVGKSMLPAAVLLEVVVCAVVFGSIGVVPVWLVIDAKQPVRNATGFVAVVAIGASILGPITGLNTAPVAIIATVSEALSMVISLFVLRSCGYRLLRCRSQV